MGRWETIDVTESLELLSPVFESEEVSIFGGPAMLIMLMIKI